MIITRIETIPIRVPIKPALAIRSGRGGSHTVSPFLLVRIHTDAGIVGLGEASCTPRWSGEDQVTAGHFIGKYFAPLLVGESVDEIASLYAKVSSTVAGNYFTKAAVEMALWDIAGKALSKPVCELLTSGSFKTAPGLPPFAESSERKGTVPFSESGLETASSGPLHEAGNAGSSSSLLAPRSLLASVPTKWSVSGVEPAKAAEIAAWAVGQGFNKMKVKVGIDPDGDVARVKAVRDAVGPTIKLGVDANGGWPTPQVAVETIHRLCHEADIYFAEQPIPPGDHDALAEVRRGVRVPIIADESVYTLADARMLARANAADVFSIYIGKAGGIGPAREIADFAHSARIKCTVGSNLELGIGSAAMIHFALSAPAIDYDTYPCDIIGPLFYEDDILVEPLPITGGAARMHDRPGLGVELNDDKVAKYRVE